MGEDIGGCEEEFVEEMKKKGKEVGVRCRVFEKRRGVGEKDD